eukprot:6637047-Karenia_brevis.AAC.1
MDGNNARDVDMHCIASLAGSGSPMPWTLRFITANIEAASGNIRVRLTRSDQASVHWKSLCGE